MNRRIKKLLTEKQFNVLIIAKNSGYFDSPRKINQKDLAKKIGISKSTLCEHLTNILNKVIHNLRGLK